MDFPRPSVTQAGEYLRIGIGNQDIRNLHMWMELWITLGVTYCIYDTFGLYHMKASSLIERKQMIIPLNRISFLYAGLWPARPQAARLVRLAGRRYIRASTRPGPLDSGSCTL